MQISWRDVFSQGKFPLGKNNIEIYDFQDMKMFLDTVQIAHGLVRPSQEMPNYPFVEAKDLLPSFESDPWEYKGLPGFSMAVFFREMQSFHEIFQYEILAPFAGIGETENSEEKKRRIANNLMTFLGRMPKRLQDTFREAFHKVDSSDLGRYEQILPYLFQMDRAHVMSADRNGKQYLSGIFASFPSDFDGELKRFGVQIGMFKPDDNVLYEKNRRFVNRFLMELYGFPIASERRTSAALFASRLHRNGESFMVRVLGQSDRTITTLWNNGERRHYPHVEKIALIKVDPSQKDLIEKLHQGGYFLDSEKLVVIARVVYKQHRFNPDNVRLDRALSLERQEVLHPLTGESLADVNVVRDTVTMMLRLNDIVRGEFIGRTVYKRNEIVLNTDTDEKRLKFIFAWLTKNQRRVIGYSDEFYTGVTRILDGYLNEFQSKDVSSRERELFLEVSTKYAYIRQARSVRILEDITHRMFRGRHLSYCEMLQEACLILRDLKFELGNYFDDLVRNIMRNIDSILDNAYLRRRYISVPAVTANAKEIRKYYRKLTGLRDEILSVVRSRRTS
ncbi:MAG: hypothetical protein PUB69_05950 [Desulfovibrionaceae bacterium]|nr:hypothetical protein [Desulfovibrionaceae bacterium]